MPDESELLKAWVASVTGKEPASDQIAEVARILRTSASKVVDDQKRKPLTEKSPG